MRLSTIIILILFGHISYGQRKADTTISKKYLDSLKTELYRQKDLSRKCHLQKIVLDSSVRVDTIKSIYGDTVTIINFTKLADTLRYQSYQIDSSRHKKGVLIDRFYYKGNFVYEEKWRYSMSGIHEWGDPLSRTRHLYDDKKNLVATIFEDYFPPGHYKITKKIFDNNKKNKVIEISRYNFWDD